MFLEEENWGFGFLLGILARYTGNAVVFSSFLQALGKEYIIGTFMKTDNETWDIPSWKITSNNLLHFTVEFSPENNWKSCGGRRIAENPSCKQHLQTLSSFSVVRRLEKLAFMSSGKLHRQLAWQWIRKGSSLPQCRWGHLSN